MTPDDASKSAQIERIKLLLLAAGLRMSVGACGCCDSPWIRFEAAGFVADLEHAGFSMFDDDKGPGSLEPL